MVGGGSGGKISWKKENKHNAQNVVLTEPNMMKTATFGFVWTATMSGKMKVLDIQYYLLHNLTKVKE